MESILAMKYCVTYVCEKTPWAGDDDLPSFFGGAIDLITKNDTNL